MFQPFFLFKKFSKKTFLFLSFLFSISIAIAQPIQLSELTEISVVVADPGTHELFEAFGHPAIRIKDPANRIDIAYNYGIFDFDQPYFYLNFTRGYLNYKVEAWPYPAFENSYIRENRSLKEYVLNMSMGQKQSVFEFLENNIKPENQHYFYDYFYDNCATRIWDAFKAALGDDLHFDESYIEPKHSFRTLVDSLTVHKPWGDFGIDLCLGLPMDKKLNSYEYMYLPEFLGRSIDHATITINGNEQPFVKSSRMIFQSLPREIKVGLFTPNFLFWSIFAFVFILTIIELVLKRKFVFLDVLIFGTAGLVGLLLFILWVATDHQAAVNNLNIIWANPLYLVGIYFLIKKSKPGWLPVYFLCIGILLLLFLIAWPINPQGINVAIIPIALTIFTRSVFLYLRLKKSSVTDQ